MPRETSKGSKKPRKTARSASRARKTTAARAVSPAMLPDHGNCESSDTDPRLDSDTEDGDELDALEFDPKARDILGDFGLDDDEALPDESDFWFDPEENSVDW
jgi:hypothetical protein